MSCIQAQYLLESATLDHDNYDANARMERVVQKVLSVDVVNINVVRVKPADWPGLTESEPIASVLKARLPLDNDRTVDNEHMLAAEIRAKTIVRNAVIVGIRALCLLFVLHGRLLLLWFFLFLLSLFLFLLGRLLRLRLFLFLLGVFVLLRVFFLRVNGSCGSQGQRQNCGADNPC